MKFIVSDSTTIAFNRWHNVNRLLSEPAPEMLMMVDSVAKALAAGLFYSNDVKAFVMNDLKDQLEGDLDIHKDNVEGGVVGMEIYYARSYLTALQEREENITAIKELDLHLGQDFGTLEINGKRTCHCIVISFSQTGQTAIVKMSGTRWKNHYNIEVSARGLLKAVRKARHAKSVGNRIAKSE